LCYLDESGTTDHSSNTQHFVLLGFAFPASCWKQVAQSLALVKSRYGLAEAEIHTGWLARQYHAQSAITDIEILNREQRRIRSETEWKALLFDAQVSKSQKHFLEEKKRFEKSKPYLHLTFEERISVLREILDSLNSMTFVRIFAECIDKSSCREKQPLELYEQAFLQVVTRFEAFLEAISKPKRTYGLLIQDNNPTVAARLTKLMKHFHDFGTRYRNIEHIIETPVFVDSQLTGMIQIADVCAFAFRRFFDNGDTDLFDRIYSRIDRKGNTLVGARHYVQGQQCACRVCSDHSKNQQ
jgi:hypothetical protein